MGGCRPDPLNGRSAANMAGAFVWVVRDGASAASVDGEMDRLMPSAARAAHVTRCDPRPILPPRTTNPSLRDTCPSNGPIQREGNRAGDGESIATAAGEHNAGAQVFASGLNLLRRYETGSWGSKTDEGRRVLSFAKPGNCGYSSYNGGIRARCPNSAGVNPEDEGGSVLSLSTDTDADTQP